MTTATPNAPGTATGRSLITEDLFDRLTARIAAGHPELSDGMPARIVDQTLAFLAATTVVTAPIGPSDLVDIGWHTFVLHTRDYAAFCAGIAGRFIHHVPDDRPGDGWPTVPDAHSGLAATVAAIRRAGFHLDLELWSSRGAAECTQCHAGCHDSPTR